MKVLNFNDPYVDRKGYVNNLGDVLSDISVDLTDYAKKTDIPATLPANGGNADTVNNHTVESDVPENAVFTDTIYDDTAVKESIEELNDSLGALGKCKNLLNPTLQTSTLNGVTCTDNGDGTFTLNGTATDDSIFYILNDSAVNLEAGTYKLILFKNISEIGVNYDIGLKFDKKGWISNNIVELLDNDTLTIIWFSIKSGITVNNLVIKPMITTYQYATYDDFVPYTGDGDTLSHDVAEINNDLSYNSHLILGFVKNEQYNESHNCRMYFDGTKLFVQTSNGGNLLEISGVTLLA